MITPEYFDTVGMRLLAGRAFRATDRAGVTRVAVVNETFARTAWPGRPAVGQRFLQAERDDLDVPVEVIGVAADAKYRYVSESPRSFVFVPLAQQPTTDITLFVKHAPGRDITADLRAAIGQVEASVPVLFMQSFDDATAIGLTPQRLTAWIAGGVGTLGAGLAALGLYGLMAFFVAQRTREIAIRMALGASATTMRTMVLGQAAWLFAGGALVGVALAGGVGTVLQSLLVGVPPVDFTLYGGTVSLFAAVLTAACWIPTRRAARTNPAEALRAE